MTSFRHSWLLPRVLAGTFLGILATPSLLRAQPSPADGPWYGSIQSVLDVQSVTYNRKETHTWTLTQDPPRVSGAFQIYRALWSVSGEGSLRRMQGQQQVSVSWAVTVPATPVEIAIGIRASDGKRLLRQWGTPTTVAGAITGTRRTEVPGLPARSNPVSAAVWEWVFPLIVDDGTPATIQGSQNMTPDALPADFFMSGLAPALATVTWNLGHSPTSAATGGTPPPSGWKPAEIARDPRSDPDARLADLERRVADLEKEGNPPPGGATGTIATPPKSSVTVTPPSGTSTAAPTPPTATAPTNPAPPPSAATNPGTPAGTVTLPPGRTVPIVNDGPARSPTFTAVPGTETPAPTTPPFVRDRPGQTLPTITNPPATQAPTSGNYLVTLSAIWCNHMTRDDPFDRDGKGDEIYATAYVRRYSRSTGAFLESYTLRTLTYGDTNGRTDRVPGGTQTATGGVAANNVLPNSGTADRRIPAQTSLLPLKLWQGTLTAGGEAIVISPLIWEDDEEPANLHTWVQAEQQKSVYLFALDKVQALVESGGFGPVILNPTERIKSGMENQLPGITAGIIAGGLGIPWDFDSAVISKSDRPIGLTRNDLVSSAVPNVVVVLTQEIIERALTVPPPPTDTLYRGVVITRAKPGIMLINFADFTVKYSGDAPLLSSLDNANYTLAIQVERL